MGQLRVLKKKQTILYQGEAVARVYQIKKGVIKAYSSFDNGSEAIIAMYGPGDFFPSSHDSETSSVSLFCYATMSDSVVEVCGLDEFAEKTKTYNQKDFSRKYLGALLHINALVQITAHEKLLHTLRYLALRFGTPLSGGVYTRINIKLTQQDIAELCNMSRETTNIELSKLKSKDVFTEKAKMYSVNLKLLNKHIGDDIGNDILG